MATFQSPRIFGTKLVTSQTNRFITCDNTAYCHKRNNYFSESASSVSESAVGMAATEKSSNPTGKPSLRTVHVVPPQENEQPPVGSLIRAVVEAQYATIWTFVEMLHHTNSGCLGEPHRLSWEGPLSTPSRRLAHRTKRPLRTVVGGESGRSRRDFVAFF